MAKMGNEIIDFILSDLDIKAPTFATNIDVAYSRIYDIQRGKTKKISAELANKIVSKYPQYNITWIISGDGDIYNGTLADRFDNYISYKGISLNDFLQSIKMTEPRYSLVMSSNIRKDELDMIYTNYPDLNPDWLLEGKGKMLRSDTSGSYIPDNNVLDNKKGDYEYSSIDYLEIVQSQQRTIESLSKTIASQQRIIENMYSKKDTAGTA